jgi:exopolysaccharide biosynthesis protein
MITIGGVRITAAAILAAAVGAAAFFAAPAPSAQNPRNNTEWQQVDEGIAVRQFDSPVKSDLGDSKISVVKIDPRYYDFRLFTASQYGNKSMSVKDWARKFGLLAAINAGMYQSDISTGIGFMRNFEHINNSRFSKNLKAVLAFNPKDGSQPPVRLIDTTCDDFAGLKEKYNTFIQGIRMINCRQRNVWGNEEKSWSIAALAMDKNGNVLFIFTRSPYMVHDFIDIILTLPLSIYNAIYLEGGVEASLYVSAGGFEMEKVGGYGTRFYTKYGSSASWPVPNVIGIVRKTRAVPGALWGAGGSDAARGPLAPRISDAAPSANTPRGAGTP